MMGIPKYAQSGIVEREKKTIPRVEEIRAWYENCPMEELDDGLNAIQYIGELLDTIDVLLNGVEIGDKGKEAVIPLNGRCMICGQILGGSHRAMNCPHCEATP